MNQERFLREMPVLAWVDQTFMDTATAVKSQAVEIGWFDGAVAVRLRLLFKWPLPLGYPSVYRRPSTPEAGRG
jgi:hypothetical protein